MISKMFLFVLILLNILNVLGKGLDNGTFNTSCSDDIDPCHHVANNVTLTEVISSLFRNYERYSMPPIVLPLPGSTQCNGINLVIISKEQSIL